ncbi:MAG TPA: hypothetical protein VMU15_19465 [Anaeromyxobacter sp.]|nr:hypothetical protein [Anaeromyxobacter sp.]
MSRKERAGARPERLAELLASGAHASARREATAVLSDPDAPPQRKERARATLAALAPEPGALLAGLVGVAIALAVSGWVLLGGAR